MDRSRYALIPKPSLQGGALAVTALAAAFLVAGCVSLAQASGGAWDNPYFWLFVGIAVVFVVGSAILDRYRGGSSGGCDGCAGCDGCGGWGD